MVIDIEKVEAAKRGDKQEFARVYDAVASDLYKVALYTLGNAHDAEDVVSETFIEAYKGISRLRDPSRFKPWIMRILSTRCKRKIAEYVRNKKQLDIDSFVVSYPDDSDLSVDVSDNVSVLEAFGRLSDQERLIISLAVMQGYTTREVSRILGSPQGTVSSKLHRALAKLRRMLDVQDQGPPVTFL